MQPLLLPSVQKPSERRHVPVSENKNFALFEGGGGRGLKDNERKGGGVSLKLKF